MMGKPLKNKQIVVDELFNIEESYLAKGKQIVFTKKVIKEAVEWLKKQVLDGNKTNFILISKVDKLIDKAFEDVIE